MTSLLSILLVTQVDQSSPSLAFAWPPRPQATPRLDRPIYKHEQSRICGSDPSLYSTKVHSDRSHPFESDHRPSLYSESSSEEIPSRSIHQVFTSNRVLSSNSSGIRNPPSRHRARQFDDQDDNATFPAPFYERLPYDSSRLNPHQPIRSLSPRRSCYLGFEPDEWADMLTPRIHGSSQNSSSNNSGGTLSGRKLELVIDALAIIAHPVLISLKPTQSKRLDRSIERGRTRTRSGEKEILNPISDSCKSPQSPFLKATFTSVTPSAHRRSSSESPIPTEVTAQDFNKLDLNHPPPSLPNLSPPPSKPPPPGPISQLTRMMNPSITPIDPSSSSNSTPLLLNTLSPASTRSNSSPSGALPARRNMGARYHSIGYSPMDVFASGPTVTMADNQQVNELSPTQPTQLIPLQSFTLALIIDTPPTFHLSRHLDVYYKDVILKLTAALKDLERDSSYLTREVQHIFQKLSERRDSNSSRSTSQRKPSEIGDIMEFIEQNSDLARALARTFDDLKTVGSTSVTLDGQSRLDLLLHGELLDSNTVPENGLLANYVKTPFLEIGDRDQFAHIESWKSLLLLQDPQVLINQVAPGSLLRDFIAIIKPALTLSEYKVLLDTDSRTIADMACHLVYWRKAKLTDVLNLTNSYQLNCPDQLNSTRSSIKTLHIPTLQNEFMTTFPNLPDLVTILSLISQRPRQPFSSILPTLDPDLDKCESMALLVWLLKRDLLVRERTYVRIKVDRRTKLKVALWKQEQKQQKSCEDNKEHTHECSSLSLRSHLQNEHDIRPISPFRGEIQALEPSSSCPDSKSVAGSLSKTVNEPPDFYSIHSVAIEAQQEREQSDEDRLSASTVNPSSTPDGYSRRQHPCHGSRPLQPESTDSITSSDDSSTAGSKQVRSRQPAVQADFFNLSDVQSSGAPEGAVDDVVLLRYKDDDLSDSIIGEPGQATSLEQKWLDEICVDKSDSQIRSFNLACRYFNGRTPLEEIVSRTNLSTESLKEILNDFESNLILLIHP